MNESRRQTPSTTTHLALEKLRQREGEKHPTIRKLSRNLKRPHRPVVVNMPRIHLSIRTEHR